MRAERTLPPAFRAQAGPDDVPVDTGRTTLYTATELYGDATYLDSPDARAFAWSLLPGDHRTQLAQALHDHAIDEALDTWTHGRRLVGVMGGHATGRGEPDYVDAAHLGRRLGATGLVVATGGGPGAMEAANLGCMLARQPPEVLQVALDRLAAVASYADLDTWLAPARAVLASLPGEPGQGSLGEPLHDSLGVPTWFYGHEPTNLFSTAIAKYFRNALREAILLQLCDAGIVFLPGAAGTVQEVFQDACENYYAEPAAVAPMVLVGAHHWRTELPVWPLLRSLAAGRAMQDHVHLVDSLDEAVALLAPDAAG